MSNYKMFEVYTIVERKNSEKGFWCRVGTAFENRDGSLNVKLDAVPVNGALHIREAKPRDDNGGQRGGRSSAPVNDAPPPGDDQIPF